MSRVVRGDEITVGMVLLSGHGLPNVGLEVTHVEDEHPGDPNGWRRVKGPDRYTQIYYDEEEVTVEGSSFIERVRGIVHAGPDATDDELIRMIQADHDVAADERGCRGCEQ